MTHYLIAAAFVLGGLGAWKVQDWRYAAKDLERAEAAAEKVRIDAKRIDTAATRHENTRTQLRTEYVVLTERIEHVLQSDFYAAGQQCFDPAGLRELATAAGPAPTASQPARAVPAPGPAR